MKAHRIISFLLVIAISLATAVHPSGVRASLRTDSEDEPKLSAQEAQEARDIATRFSERLNETNDFGPLVNELFVSDFSQRLRQAPTNSLPWALLDKKLIAQASPDELRRSYFAGMNFYALTFRLYEAAERQRMQATDENESEVSFGDVLSPEVLGVLLSDPTLKKLVELANEEESNEHPKEDDSGQPAESGNPAQAEGAAAEADNEDATEKDEIGIVKSLSQLDSILTTLEKANGLMRQQLASMLFISPVLLDVDESKHEPELQNLRLTTLDEGEYGYPKNTPVIHVDVMPFCLHLIRENRQLKIISALIYVD